MKLVCLLICYFICIGNIHANRHRHKPESGLQEDNEVEKYQTGLDQYDVSCNTDVMLGIQPDPEIDQRFAFLISEISIDHPQITDEDSFIELKSNVNNRGGRRPLNIMDNHMLLILGGEPLSIMLTVNFNDRSVRISIETLYIVIGSGPNTDIPLTSPAVQNSQIGNFNEFSKCQTSPCAVVLLRNNAKSQLNRLKLRSGGTLSFVALNIQTDVDRQNIILNSIEDLVIFGRSSKRIGFFDKMLQLKSKPEGSYLLRNFATTLPTIFTSINYCSVDFTRFNVAMFKTGALTKKRANSCTGNFIAPSFQVAAFNSLPRRTVINTETPIINVRVLQAAAPVWHNPYLPPVFQNDWLDQCKTSFINQGRFLTFTSFQSWVVMIIRNEKCHTRCHVCHSYFYRYGMRPDIKHRPNIVKEIGSFDENLSRNSQALIDHKETEYHKEASAFLHHVSMATSQVEYDNIIHTAFVAQEPVFHATINVIKSLYFVIKTNNPLAQHPRQIELLNHFGIKVGEYQHNELAASKIAEVISHEFHVKLLKSLVLRQEPFSLLADESTDVSNTGFIVIMFQSIEDNFSVMYFYSLLELTEGQTADGMFSVLNERLQEDEILVPGFINFFKNNVVALVNDGASSMVGIKHSWMTEINTFIRPRQVSKVHCIAHRMQLVMQSAIEKPSKNDPRFAYFQSFEKTLNRFYSFYMSRGSKRWQHLKDVAEQLNLTKPKRIRYIFNVRWAASHYHALKNLHDDYQLIKYDLIAIASDPSFDKTAQQNAWELHDIIADRSFSIVLRELLDALTIFKEISLVFQESAGLLVGKSRVVNKGFQKFQDLKFEPGPYVSKFLKECSCKHGCVKPMCTIQNYDDCKDLEFNGNLLEKLDSKGIRLSNARPFLYQAFIDELKIRFSFDILQGMELFDPIKINFLTLTEDGNVPPPAPVGELDIYYLRDEDDDVLFPEVSNDRKIEIVCNFYFINQADCEIFAIEWVNVIRSITRNAFLIRERIIRPELFWPAALSEPTVLWSQITKRVIYCVLATGNNNAASERSFSLMSTTKSKSRSHTGSKLLENYLRIKINGPDKIEDFNALYYTSKFLENHAPADSTVNLGGRTPAPEKYPSFFKNSRIFN